MFVLCRLEVGQGLLPSELATALLEVTLLYVLGRRMMSSFARRGHSGLTCALQGFVLQMCSVCLYNQNCLEAARSASWLLRG